MKTESLSLNHQLLLNEKLKPLGDGLSEYCFSNLYLFRNVHDYRVVFDDRLFLSGNTYDNHSFLMPVFDLSEVTSQYLLDKLKGYDFYFPISEESSKLFDKRLFTISYNGNDSDYVFAAEKLIHYGGRKLAKKKNLMKQFLEMTTPTAVPYDGTQKKAAEEILYQWLDDVDKPVSETDVQPCLEALANAEKLDLFGVVYYAGGEPAGFLLARELIPGMCVFHFAKGKREYKGIFQYMFNQFASYYKQRFNYYNFEQDLGKPNFRKTKQSYDPDVILRKYRITLT
jgi:hypothetical protein